MQDGVMREWLETSHLAGGNVAYIEQMFEAYLDDPTAVSDEWRKVFDALPSDGQVTDTKMSDVREQASRSGEEQTQTVWWRQFSQRPKAG